MARYIDADKLINELGDCTLATWGKGLGASWWAQSVKLKDNMVECINKQPTADVVEVVRCKDCDRSAKYKDYYLCGVDNRAVNADSFCSYGERKIDNEV